MVVGSTEDFKTHGGIQPGAGLAGRHFYPTLLGQGCGVKSFLKSERTTKEKVFWPSPQASTQGLSGLVKKAGSSPPRNKLEPPTPLSTMLGLMHSCRVEMIPPRAGKGAPTHSRLPATTEASELLPAALG